MALSSIQHRRAHNLLLISKLLSQRDGVSPFTLIIDGIEQSARPLVAEHMRRAESSKTAVVFVSFENLRKPQSCSHFIEAWRFKIVEWRNEVTKYIKSLQTQKTLLIIDSLNAVCAAESANLPMLLSSFIGPNISLLGVYHADVALPPPSKSQDGGEYSPSPLTLLKYIATTLLTTDSLPHVLARKAARERSVIEPSFGLDQGTDGIIQGLGANAAEAMVFEMEYRRKSGRGIRETFVLLIQPQQTKSAGTRTETVLLLDDHPLYRSQQLQDSGNRTSEKDEEGSTFDLGLTERQRRDRDAVVLPYFDAQKGSGEGGRILYDMGEEDDFDEEEDEI